ncbi:MAG: bifunctional UDP-N-acetylglucosamine diphosphorylase/glucosamine-1-phosphate N-acetyltransferase GlmU [Pseudomonadota bacterium]
MNDRAAIILAAGRSTRMKSSLSKVLHPIGGKPNIDWSISLANALGCSSIVSVVASATDPVAEHVKSRLGPSAIAVQSPALGTGHAVMCAEPALDKFQGYLIVLYGDSPLVPVEAIEALFEVLDGGAKIGVLGFEAQNPGLYGRLVTSEAGHLEAIVEAREATPEQLNIKLCNSGVMAGDAKTMFRLLKQVTNDNAKGEYYLTDLVGLARNEGFTCGVVVCAEDDLVGCDSRTDLAKAEAIFQRRIRKAMMEGGVTLLDPETVYFSHDTEIAPDVTIEPHVIFGPGVSVGSGSRINAFSHIQGASIGPGCQIGPHARLRPGTTLAANVKIGNFVEVKQTDMGEGAKASHLSYLGDGRVGAGANLGAGTIFCNYDGFLKYQTDIGSGAFVGSNTALVAPVRVGENAMVGSGSVVTKDVPPDALAIARSRQEIKPNWAARFREIMRSRKKKLG